MAKIKFAIRRNLIYPIQHIIWNFARQVLTMILGQFFDFSGSLIFSPLMFLGELFGGAAIYFYQKKIMPKKKEEKEQYFMSIKLITQKDEDGGDDYYKEPLDNNIKILFLIFLSSFFDGVEFVLGTAYLPRYMLLSNSLSKRLSGISTLFTLFFYLYALKLPIYKHHKFSIAIIGICLILVIIFEYYFQEINIFLNYGKFSVAIILIIFIHLFMSLKDSIEKYLFEYDYMNPFVVLMYEGMLGFLLNFLFFLIPGYLDDIRASYHKFSTNEFALFVFLLFLYVIFSAGKNIFLLVTTKIYTPMAKSLSYL